MFALISTLFITWIIMWMFFRFMYPKPPKAFFPQAGDVTTLRICDYCGHELAQYRGIVEKKSPQNLTSDDGLSTVDIECVATQTSNNDSEVQVKTKSVAESDKKSDSKDSDVKPSPFFAAFVSQKAASKDSTHSQPKTEALVDAWFFCNTEHQASFHAGEVYPK